MEMQKESNPEDKSYKIMLLRFGKAIIKASSRDEASEKALYLDETEIDWLSEKDGIPGGRVLTLIELQEEII